MNALLKTQREGCGKKRLKALRAQVARGAALIVALSISLNTGKWRTSSVFCLCCSLTTGRLSTPPAMHPLFTLIIVWCRFVGGGVVVAGGGVTVTGSWVLAWCDSQPSPGWAQRLAPMGPQMGRLLTGPLLAAAHCQGVTWVAFHTRTLSLSNEKILTERVLFHRSQTKWSDESAGPHTCDRPEKKDFEQSTVCCVFAAHDKPGSKPHVL